MYWELHAWFVYWNNLTPPAAQKRALMSTSRLVVLLCDSAHLAQLVLSIELFMKMLLHKINVVVILKQAEDWGSRSMYSIYRLSDHCLLHIYPVY